MIALYVQQAIMQETTVFNSKSSFYTALSGICLLVLMVYFKDMSSPIILNAALTQAREASHGQTFSLVKPLATLFLHLSYSQSFSLT